MGIKIDATFTDLIELTLLAGYARRDQKLFIVERASAKLDTLKFFIRVAWDIKSLDHKHHAMLAEPLAEAGKMLGGWMKQLTKLPPTDAGGSTR